MMKIDETICDEEEYKQAASVAITQHLSKRNGTTCSGILDGQSVIPSNPEIESGDLSTWPTCGILLPAVTFGINNQLYVHL